ncbi:hypothetical protein [Parageobacillus thermoglucosidasius]|uniref:hypothetical protein n=1 Tax=Parageobacillus thermoglucosidasius TaxID=1426 RepID=UPI00025B81CF|nr:hypothetical protein [Parageobacillus thermoglucosidasius]EID42886.1 putative phage protein [Parageobacillus thermoglucosidasius TNO-09.020]KYD17885.1 hypothetical protein B4168_2446 [Anoxybacillus flavithermus]OAO85334.1 hypothetical protein GT23_3025 [Parageobacillus thermoglucosidasius]
MANNVVAKKEFGTQLTKVNDIYLPMIQRQMQGNGIQMDGYSKQCVLSAIGAINNVLDTNGVSWNDPNLDKSNITQVLLNVAALKLNASAHPREVYFQLRNVKVKDKDGNEHWKKQIEMGIEGDGNDAILSRFGRNVKEVKQFWLVRENDKFEYPTYNGLEMTPPKWTPTGKGKVVRVVYPIIKKDNTIEFYISEREDVLKNLIAHINNNLMNETFGLAENRYKATTKQKEQIAEKKRAILEKAEKLGLDSALDDPELQQYISPAWKDPQSRESMIVRKMRNNIVKKIPKDFGNAYIGLIYEENTDQEYIRVRKEIEENANQEELDFEEVEYEEAQEVEVIDQPDPKPANVLPNEETLEEQKQEQMQFENITEGPGF